MSKLILLLGPARCGGTWLNHKFTNKYNKNLHEILHTQKNIGIKEFIDIHRDCKNNNLNLVLKINIGQILKDINLFIYILLKCDYIIFFNRNNKLAQYISDEKSKLTESYTQQSNDKFKIDKNNMKINWNENIYINRIENKNKIYEKIKKFASRNKKSYIEFMYEEIHEQNMTEDQKFIYVKNKILNIDPQVKLDNSKIIKKESNYQDIIKDNFNEKDFEKIKIFFNL
jgi:hypothetical protein